MGLELVSELQDQPEGQDDDQGSGLVLISPISFYEVAQKVRLSKWPEMKHFVDDLLRLSEQQGATIAASGAAIMLRAGHMDWLHRDPFDRILAATALHHAVPIVSADPVSDGVVGRVW